MTYNASVERQYKVTLVMCRRFWVVLRRSACMVELLVTGSSRTTFGKVEIDNMMYDPQIIHGNEPRPRLTDGYFSQITKLNLRG